MRYQGGKERIASRLVENFPSRIGTYVEPFVGGMSVASRVEADRYILSDANEALISLYVAWKDGWRPDRIDETTYERLRSKQDVLDPRTAFAGFGMSFGGKWFGGFARSKDRDYFQNALNSLTRKMSRLDLSKVRFVCSDYRNLEIPQDAFVYCDPPYRGTTGYAATGGFDSNAFWNWAATLENCLVSEYSAPEGWSSIWSKDKNVDMRLSGGAIPRTESLFAKGGE